MYELTRQMAEPSPGEAMANRLIMFGNKCVSCFPATGKIDVGLGLERLAV